MYDKRSNDLQLVKLGTFGFLCFDDIRVLEVSHLYVIFYLEGVFVEYRYFLVNHLLPPP
jgi:hypothetical protein